MNPATAIPHGAIRNALLPPVGDASCLPPPVPVPEPLDPPNPVLTVVMLTDTPGDVEMIPAVVICSDEASVTVGRPTLYVTVATEVEVNCKDVGVVDRVLDRVVEVDGESELIVRERWSVCKWLKLTMRLWATARTWVD
jgi:hypothetical protein